MVYYHTKSDDIYLYKTLYSYIKKNYLTIQSTVTHDLNTFKHNQSDKDEEILQLLYLHNLTYILFL